MKKSLLALSLLIMAGCSTTPVLPHEAKNVSPIIKYQQRQGLVPVTIIRDKGIIASACEITIYINGDQVANLDTSEKVVAYVNAGNIIVGAGFIGSGLCSGPERKERYFNINDKEPLTLRVFTDQNANVDILPTTIK
ncbi:TPA: hypothetical protein QHB98_001812 [Citrobacter braakii]|nr:hypothetical protein [Citrobacter braakii]